MKLGLVLECDTGGPDELVLTSFARRLRPGIKVQANALGDKPTVFSRGAEAAQNLIEHSGCDLVLIVWDLKPYFEGPPPAEGCEDETATMRAKLEAVPTTVRAKIRLLCLTWEIETWLLADPKAINAHLSTPTHRAKVRGTNPLRRSDAKAALDRICKAHRGRASGYTDYREAIRIACEITTTNKIGEVPSFARFSTLVTGNPKADFKDSSAVCRDLIHDARRLGR